MSETGSGDPCQPRMKWEEMEDLVEGELVLARNADRQVFGYRQDGVWFELMDGEEFELTGFEPIEWCFPPGGAEQWA